MKLEKSYSNYIMIKYCRICGWYQHKFANKIDNSMLCCPKCGEDAEMVKGRYKEEQNIPTNTFEFLRAELLFSPKFHVKTVGFELKE